MSYEYYLKKFEEHQERLYQDALNIEASFGSFENESSKNNTKRNSKSFNYKIKKSFMKTRKS
jgi:hypothetical protein